MERQRGSDRAGMNLAGSPYQLSKKCRKRRLHPVADCKENIRDTPIVMVHNAYTLHGRSSVVRGFL